MATRNRLSLAGQGGSALLDSLDAFKRKHVSQNKEIIHRNSELMRLNAELNKQVRDLQAEAVDLRTDNARLTTAYNSVYTELQISTSELERLKSQGPSAAASQEKLRQALQLITATADEAISSLLITTDGGNSESDYRSESSAQSQNEEGDTILASSSLSNRDRQPPLVSSKPDLSLIDEASHEESFYRQSLPWYRPSSAPEDLQHPEPPSLLPPSIVSSRPRRSSSTASLRPMLDEVHEESERSPSTSPTSSPSATVKIDHNRIFDDTNITDRRRSLIFNSDHALPGTALDDLSTSSEEGLGPDSLPQYQETNAALEQAVQDLSITDDKPDVLPRRKRAPSQPQPPAQSTSSSRAKEKEPTNAASSTVSSRARRRPSLSRPGSQQNLREAAQQEEQASQQQPLRKRKSTSSLAGSSASSSNYTKAPSPSSSTLSVRPRPVDTTSAARGRSQSPPPPQQDGDFDKALDRISSMSRRGSTSSFSTARRSVSASSVATNSRAREPSPGPTVASPMSEDMDPMTPPPQVDMDGLVVKKRVAPPHQDMQPLAEESESQGRRSTSTLASSSSSSRIASTEPPPTPTFDERGQTLAEDEDTETVGSRRARKSVNYALPNLRDKMRKPAGYSAPTTKRSVSSSDVRASKPSEDRAILGDASNSLTLPRRKSSATLNGNSNKEDVQPIPSISRRPSHQRLASS